MTLSPQQLRKIFDVNGQRLTSCCASYSTYCEDGTGGADVLCCKSCYHEVTVGEGDGNEFADGVTFEDWAKATFGPDAIRH